MATKVKRRVLPIKILETFQKDVRQETQKFFKLATDLLITNLMNGAKRDVGIFKKAEIPSLGTLVKSALDLPLDQFEALIKNERTEAEQLEVDNLASLKLDLERRMWRLYALTSNKGLRGQAALQFIRKDASRSRLESIIAAQQRRVDNLNASVSEEGPLLRKAWTELEAHEELSGLAVDPKKFWEQARDPLSELRKANTTYEKDGIVHQGYEEIMSEPTVPEIVERHDNAREYDYHGTKELRSVNEVLSHAQSDGNYLEAKRASLMRGDVRNEVTEESNGSFTYKDLAAQLNDRIAARLLNPLAAVDKDQVPVARIVLGKPGAGKSTYNYASQLEEVLVDVDKIAPALPGYHPNYAANYLTWASDVATLLMYRTTLGRYNVCIDVQGREPKAIEELGRLLKALDYDIKIVLVETPMVESLKRAYCRFKTGGRFVDLEEMVQTFGKRSGPKDSYNRLKKVASEWVMVVDSEVVENGTAS